jgi:geranylgeranyl diphosphate synthase type I
MGICAGDATLFLAFELLAEAGNTPTVRAVAQQLFSQQLVDTCIGQMHDVYYEVRPAMPSKQAIYGIMQAKTAAYTIALPLAMGAALAGQPTATLRQLQAIGIAAGTIFQIRDDELGAMGDSRQTGKPVGADIREGKKTLLYYYLMKKCTATEGKKVKAIFGNPDSTAHDIIYIQKLIRQHCIPQLLNKDISRLQKKAITAIGELPVTTRSKDELTELVTFCAQRQS